MERRPGPDQHVRKVVSADVIVSFPSHSGGARQKSAYPKIKEDMWNAAQEQVSMDMPESHGKAEHTCWRKAAIADVILSFTNRAGGAGQKSAFPKIKEDLWNAAQEQVSMDMPESHEKAERGQMAEDGLAGASPEDQASFPSNVEDQVPLADPRPA